MSAFLSRLGLVVLSSLLLALLVGLLLEAVWGLAFWACCLLVILLGQYRHLWRLLQWSRHPSLDVDFEGDGIWDDIFGRLYRHERELRWAIERRDQDLRQVTAAAEALVDGIVTLDADNRIVWCNSTAARQLGLNLRSDRGRPVGNLVRDPAFIAYLAQGDFRRPLRLISERSGGAVLSVLLLPYAGGNRLLQVRDVTQSEHLERMRRDFVANVSHELRTPLTVLSGALENLRDLNLNAQEGQQCLRLMSGQAERMKSIVEDLLTLSTLESSPPPPEDERVHMAALLDRIYADAQALSAGRHKMQLHVEPVDLRGAASELSSALSNLVANAIRYTPSGGCIQLCWKSLSGGAAFSVTDEGIGIDAEHIPRLTERFYRVDSGRSREVGGTGLGLAIVKHVLSRHQASLDIQSTPGQGSCFTVRFPSTRVLVEAAVEQEPQT